VRRAVVWPDPLPLAPAHAVPRARAHRFWFGLLTVPARNHRQITKRSILGLFICFRGVACGQFRLLLYPQGAGRFLLVKVPFMSAAGWRNPQHFDRACTGSAPLCTGAPHACAHIAGQLERAALACEYRVPSPVKTPPYRSCPRTIAVARSGGGRGGVTAPAGMLRPLRMRQGPSMYEMERPCPGSPRWVAGCPA
jgi:hypothetical protein